MGFRKLSYNLQFFSLSFVCSVNLYVFFAVAVIAGQLVGVRLDGCDIRVRIGRIHQMLRGPYAFFESEKASG